MTKHLNLINLILRRKNIIFGDRALEIQHIAIIPTMILASRDVYNGVLQKRIMTQVKLTAMILQICIKKWYLFLI